MDCLLLNYYLFILLVLFNSNSLVLGRSEESDVVNTQPNMPVHRGKGPPPPPLGGASTKDEGHDKDGGPDRNEGKPEGEQQGAGRIPADSDEGKPEEQGSTPNREFFPNPVIGGGSASGKGEGKPEDEGSTLKSEDGDQQKGEGDGSTEDGGRTEGEQQGSGRIPAGEEGAHSEFVKVEEFNKYKEETEAKLKEITDNETKKFDDLEQKLAVISEHVAVVQKAEEKLEESNAPAKKAEDTKEAPDKANTLSFMEPSVNCPLECKGCVNPNEKNMFCINSKSECGPVKTFNNFSCDSGFTPCGLFEVSNNQQFNFKNSDIVSKTPQTVQLQGSNMNVCIKLLIVPDGLHCNKENIDTLSTESQKILTPGFTSTLVPNGIVFTNIVLNASKGKYKVCLAQYTNDRRINNSTLQTLTNILFKHSNIPPSIALIQDAATITIE